MQHGREPPRGGNSVLSYTDTRTRTRREKCIMCESDVYVCVCVPSHVHPRRCPSGRPPWGQMEWGSRRVGGRTARRAPHTCIGGSNIGDSRRRPAAGQGPRDHIPQEDPMPHTEPRTCTCGSSTWDARHAT